MQDCEYLRPAITWEFLQFLFVHLLFSFIEEWIATLLLLVTWSVLFESMFTNLELGNSDLFSSPEVGWNYLTWHLHSATWDFQTRRLRTLRRSFSASLNFHWSWSFRRPPSTGNVLRPFEIQSIVEATLSNVAVCCGKEIKIWCHFELELCCAHLKPLWIF